MEKHFAVRLPPIITRVLKHLQLSSNGGSAIKPDIHISHNLFDNEPNFLEEEVKHCTVYGEYGTGSSTQFVLNYSDVAVICVDTNPYWLQIATHGFSESPRLYSRSVDVGEVMAWGIPVGSARIDQFKEYTDWIWEQQRAPDLVLIDGRFRVCCFLTTLKRCKPGCRIIFDDYVHRPQYHFVEKFLAPREIRGRQALFEVPDDETWNEGNLDFAIEAFRCNLN